MLPIDSTVYFHAFKDSKILRGRVTGYTTMEGFGKLKPFYKIRKDDGEDIVLQYRHETNADENRVQASLKRTYYKQNRTPRQRKADYWLEQRARGRA